MRIAGGEFRGRTLAVPRGLDVRPTQDRVREALFSMILPAVSGANVLDLCAGSGAVGLEALSRGAARSVFVEVAQKALSALSSNIDALDCRERATVVRADAWRWVASSASSGGHFGIVFADPPYALWEEKGIAPMLEALAAEGRTVPGALFIAETLPETPVPGHPSWRLLRERSYGRTRLLLWRLESALA